MPSSCGRWGATPEWAITGRVPSARSKARFTERSSTERFQVGSLLAEGVARRQLAHVHRRARLDVEAEGLVVAAPEHHRRVVAEEVDGLARLAHGRLA